MARRFRGESDHKVDSKGRVSIPASFRRVIESCDPEWTEGLLPRLIIVYGGITRDHLEGFTIEAMDEEAAAQAGASEDEVPPVPPGPVEARTVRDDCFVYSFAMQMHGRLGRLAMDAEQLAGDSDGATDASEVEGFAATLAAT